VRTGAIDAGGDRGRSLSGRDAAGALGVYTHIHASETEVSNSDVLEDEYADMAAMHSDTSGSELNDAVTGCRGR
jgi:hypothetical protein